MRKDFEVHSRSGRAFRNTTVTSACHVLYLLSGFVCRTVFTRALGAEYLGIGGLFTNILTILSFAELGVGSAMVYRLYAPLAHHDDNTVLQYLVLYRRAYRWITLTIVICGVAVTPFLGYLVEAPNVKESVTLLYLLYLSNTVASYIFAYRKSLLIADQNDYIVSIITDGFNILSDIVRCVLLVMTHDFVLYCVVGIIAVLTANVACAVYAGRKYRFLSKKVSGALPKTEIVGLKNDIKGLMLTKVASTAFSGTDNLFISAYIGLRYVGILSNYMLVLTIINGLLNKIFGSLTAIIGNLAVERNSEESTEAVLKRLFFLNTALYGYLCVGMIILLRDFVTKIWLMPEYDLPQLVVSVAVIELFLRSIHFPMYTIRTAMGLFSQKRMWFVGAAVLNIVLDFVLIKPLGITGLFIATIICRGITYCVDIDITYRIGLKKTPAGYLGMLAKWVLFLTVCTLLSGAAVQIVQGNNKYIIFALRILVISVIYAVLFYLAFHKSDEYNYFLSFLKKVLRGRNA